MWKSVEEWYSLPKCMKPDIQLSAIKSCPAKVQNNSIVLTFLGL